MTPPPFSGLGTKLVDLPVQFPWPIGTNGAGKLGLTSRSGGRPASYWGASLKGVTSGSWWPRFRTTSPRGLGGCLSARVERASQGPAHASSAAAAAAAVRVLGIQARGRRGAGELTSPARLDLRVAVGSANVPCSLLRGMGELEAASTGTTAGGSTSAWPGACRLGSYEPKTVAVVKAKPAGSGGLGTIDGRIWLFDVALRSKRNRAVPLPRPGLTPTQAPLPLRHRDNLQVCNARRSQTGRHGRAEEGICF